MRANRNVEKVARAMDNYERKLLGSASVEKKLRANETRVIAYAEDGEIVR
jgi:hypothetical protein